MTPTHSLTSITPSVSTASGLLSRPLISNGASPPSSSNTAKLVRPPLHEEERTGGGQPLSHAVVLTKQDYYTVPPCDELDEMVQDGCCVVEGFTIGRWGFGEIHFPDKTDVYGMNLDQLGEQLREINTLASNMDVIYSFSLSLSLSLSLVLIDVKEVQVYPDDEDKPPVGKGLNKTAIVRLEKNWPVDKTTREMVTDPDRIEKMGYVNKLKRSTAKIGATFIDYFPESGTCVFQVGVPCFHDNTWLINGSFP